MDFGHQRPIYYYFKPVADSEFWRLVVGFGLWRIVSYFGLWTIVTDFGFKCLRSISFRTIASDISFWYRSEDTIFSVLNVTLQKTIGISRQFYDGTTEA